jgi:hypothetical protein
MKEIIEKRGEKDFRKVMKNISVRDASDIYSLYKVIYDYAEELEKKFETPGATRGELFMMIIYSDFTIVLASEKSSLSEKLNFEVVSRCTFASCLFCGETDFLFLRKATTNKFCYSFILRQSCIERTVAA